MRNFLPAILSFTAVTPCFSQLTPFEEGNGNQSATYEQVIEWYRMLDSEYPQASLEEAGTTDTGKPLHLFILSAGKVFEPRDDQLVLLINNGIHPGEPEGIDASMMWARDLLKNGAIPPEVTICLIPVYNVGGMLNRGGFSRANQNGPEAYGFRGNARNLDLNRDFIKSDSRNVRSFQQIFQRWKPDVFLDTHTTNGADYQHVITYISTQKDKLQKHLSRYMSQGMLPRLNKRLTDKGFPPAPYVYTKGEIPEDGLIGFYDSPRYSTGYAALFNTLGFVLETHMLKPFDQRVAASYVFMEELLGILAEDKELIRELREKAVEKTLRQRNFVLDWELDTTRHEQIPFMGYVSGHRPSAVSGQPALYYDRSKPFTREIPWYNHYQPRASVSRPRAYVIPQAWRDVTELLELNGIALQRIQQDTTIDVQAYYIEDFQTARAPYEGHYLHSDVKMRKEKQTLDFYPGDYLVKTDQPAVRYMMETLEPQATDSYFAWNFFDSILGQKEYFSPYVFEETAVKLLEEDRKLGRELARAKEENPELAEDGRAQLDFIYRNSPRYEKTHLRYPVYRIE